MIALHVWNLNHIGPMNENVTFYQHIKCYCERQVIIYGWLKRNNDLKELEESIQGPNCSCKNLLSFHDPAKRIAAEHCYEVFLT